VTVEYKLTNHFGLSESIVLLLIGAGYRTPAEIRVLSDETLLAIDGIDQTAVNAIRSALGAQI